MAASMIAIHFVRSKNIEQRPFYNQLMSRQILFNPLDITPISSSIDGQFTHFIDDMSCLLCLKYAH